MGNIENALQIGGYLSGIPKQQYLDLERKYINSEAKLDVYDMTSGATDVYWDLFDGYNDHSAGILDTTKTKATSPLTAGDTNLISKVDISTALTKWFQTGQEITIADDVNSERVIISNGGVSEESVTRDFSTPLTAVNSTYTTSASARPQYLSNGNIVAVENNAGTIQLQLWESSTQVFRDLCSISGATTGCKPSIASKGNVVYVVFNTATIAYSVKIDTTTVTNTDQNANKVVIDTVSSFSEGLTLVIDSTGTYLHFGDSSKVPAYSLSFNIRYAKGTISAVDGSVTWGSVEQRTTDNTTGVDYTNPSIALKSGNPIIAYMVSGAGTAQLISCKYYNGTIWSAEVFIHNGSSYAQSSPDIISDQSGILWVTWHGTDSTDTSIPNIHCKKSIDYGVNWLDAGVTGNKITSGNSYWQRNPSITFDSNNNIYIMWSGGTVDYPSCTNICKIIYSGENWGSVVRLTSNNSSNAEPCSTCLNHQDFTDPICVYLDIQTTAVKFRGIFTVTTITPHLEVTALQNNYKTNTLCYRSLGNVDTVNGRLGFSNGYNSTGSTYIKLLEESVIYNITPAVSSGQIASWIKYQNSPNFSIDSKFSIKSSGNEVFLTPTKTTTVIDENYKEDQYIISAPVGSQIAQKIIMTRVSNATEYYIYQVLGALG